MFWWIVGLIAFAGLTILVSTLYDDYPDDDYPDDEDWWDD